MRLANGNGLTRLTSLWRLVISLWVRVTIAVTSWPRPSQFLGLNCIWQTVTRPTH